MAEKQKSITRNYIYNITLTLLNLIFPLITFPRVSRVIGAMGVGKVSFAMSIVNYFITFAALGIPTYGVREIARVRDNKERVSKVFTEIFTINAIATTICSLVYFILVMQYPYFSMDRNLYIVVGLMLILNVFGIDWMYQGFENYKYITIRSIIFKIISIILLFTLVNTKNDYVIYAAITVLGLSGVNIINAIAAGKYVRISFKNLNLKRHFKPIGFLLSTQLAISIYANLDSTMLGVLSGKEYVGYYTAALKINRMVLGIVTSLGVVLLPRLSYYIKKDMKEQFDSLVLKSVQFILFLGLPACVGLYMLAPEIIRLFSGNEFIPAITAMRLSVPIIILIGLSNLTGIQILIPLGKEKQLLISVIAGALINFGMNLVLIPIYKQNGAAISSSVAELTVLLVQLLYIKEYMKGKIINKINLTYVIGALFVSIIVFLIHKFNLIDIYTTILSVILGGIFYIIYTIITKDPITNEILGRIIKRRG